jgi:transposase
MLYTAIDYHKRYSVACTMDAAGARVKEARIDNAPEAFASYFRVLPERSQVVMEACWNWAWLYDLLNEIEQVEDVVLANPAKTRIIADAQIKTDRLDAQALCTLLRGQLVAQAYAPDQTTRAKKRVLRQRVYWVRMRTMLRNRIHVILDRQRALDRPVCTDLFGKKGLGWLQQLQLPDPDSLLLQQSMALLNALGDHIKAIEKRLQQENENEAAVQHLQTLPGVGPILSAVIAAEIGPIERFNRADKLCAYAGLAPTTYASGGHVHHGRLLPFCNRWLRWAFIEAAWTGISCSPYLGALYTRQRTRGKKTNVAIIIVAHRMCQITWSLLREQRDFSTMPPKKIFPPVAPILK